MKDNYKALTATIEVIQRQNPEQEVAANGQQAEAGKQPQQSREQWQLMEQEVQEVQPRQTKPAWGAPKQCPVERCQAWMSSLATECPYAATARCSGGTASHPRHNGPG